MTTQPTCKQRWAVEKNQTVRTLRKLWDAYCKGNSDPDLGEFTEYGLSFDYVEPGTFNGQREGYWRYQISWGGPSDEFRFYATATRRGYVLHRVEYCFMDWFDGYCRKLRGRDESLLEEVFDWFCEIGSAEAAWTAACDE